jgi:hypothetical protein
MLICAWIVAATAFLCKAVPVRDYKRVPMASDHVRVVYGREAFNRSPTTAEFAWRLAWCGPTAIILTLAAIWSARWAFKDWITWARYNAAMKLRFTLRDLLLVIALIALAMAWRFDSARKVNEIQRQAQVIKMQDSLEQKQRGMVNELTEEAKNFRISGYQLLQLNAYKQKHFDAEIEQIGSKQ